MDSYNKTVWVNGSNPPINAENLNHIESGIEAVNQAVTAAEERITTSESKIETLEGQYQSVDSDLADITDEMLLVEKTGNKVNIINPATPSNTDYPTTAAVVEYVSDYLDKHPVSGAEKFVEVTDTSDTVVDNCTDPDTVYIVKVVSGVVTTTKMRVICTPNVAGQMAQYAMTKDGYIISRKFTASKWGAWDFIPDSKRVAAMILAAITGKADKANSLSGYGITNAYNKTEVDYALAHKADKSTTLAGYGITDAYTKSEVDELITDTEKTGNKVNIINPAAPSNTDYPTTAAVIKYVNSVLRGLTNNGN